MRPSEAARPSGNEPRRPEPKRAKLAVFDIDGTLVRGSSERLFARFLLRRGKLGWRQAAAYLVFLLRYGIVWGADTARKNKAYLAGLDPAELEALAGPFVGSHLVDRLFEPAVQRLQRHLDHGDTVLLLSGTLDCLARALAGHLGVRYVRATVCAEHNGRFAAQPPAVHPFGTEKLTVIRAAARELSAELEDVTAYANSHHDLALLAAVGTPVAVRPDAALLKTALERNWEIIARDRGALDKLLDAPERE